jgi:hypothetical protein
MGGAGARDCFRCERAAGGRQRGGDAGEVQQTRRQQRVPGYVVGAKLRRAGVGPVVDDLNGAGRQGEFDIIRADATAGVPGNVFHGDTRRPQVAGDAAAQCGIWQRAAPGRAPAQPRQQAGDVGLGAAGVDVEALRRFQPLARGHAQAQHRFSQRGEVVVVHGPLKTAGTVYGLYT